MFSIYGSAHVGIFGSIIEETNVEQILKLNCLATDFYADKSFPTFLYYNPYDESKEISYSNESDGKIDLFDVISGTIVAENIGKEKGTSMGAFSIPADAASLIVAVPHGARITQQDGKYICNEKVIAHY